MKYTLKQLSDLYYSPVLGHYTYLEIEKGKGSYLYTKKGQKILGKLQVS